mmetsp:Transcript_46917/g.111685  ORF Transcript_46917/g.111685 Transcript_46917/m.111685 type:complete len:215 (-) Transcript_46917:1384-2028(-)
MSFSVASYEASFTTNGSIDESAPLTSSISAPSPFDTTTEVRLRVLSKMLTLRTCQISSMPFPTLSPSPATRSMIRCASSRLLKKTPRLRAPCTNAHSSWDSAWYCGKTPSPSTSEGPYPTWTVWLSARWVRNMRMFSLSALRRQAPFASRSSTKLNAESIPAWGWGFGGSFCPLRRAIARSTSQYPRPYDTPAMEHLRNSMRFCVSVPVLSEKM